MARMDAAPLALSPPHVTSPQVTPLSAFAVAGGAISGGAISGGDVLALAQRRLAWVAVRNAVLAENIANVDTPRYRPRDIGAFADTLGSAVGGGGRLALRQPDSVVSGGNAAPGLAAPGSSLRAAEVTPIGRAPDGNAVSLESNMTALADGQANALFTGNVWKAYLRMFATALGRGG